MRFLPVLLGVVLSLAACTTERVIEPNDAKLAADLNAQLGLGYMNQGHYKRAMEKLEKSLKFNSDNVQAHHYKAELHRRLNQADEAEKHYQEAMSLAPKDANIKNNYGVFLCEQGKYDLAYAQFKSSTEDPLYTARAAAHENIGLCSMREGKLREAEQSFRNALKINPKMPKSLIELAQLSYDRGNKKEAYDYFSRYVAIAQHTPESLWMGILLENERNNKNTVASYKVLLKGKYPDSKQAKLLEKLERQGKL